MNITRMSLHITHKVPKSHAWCENHTRVCGITASQNKIWISWWSYVNFSWFVSKPHASCWNSTRAYVNPTRACRYHTCECHNHTRECHNHTHECQNHTLRVEITVVRFEFTIVIVVITFMRVKITLRLEITLCLYKAHWAFRNYTMCVNYKLVDVEPWRVLSPTSMCTVQEPWIMYVVHCSFRSNVTLARNSYQILFRKNK
jgi:hypothetical protein